MIAPLFIFYAKDVFMKKLLVIAAVLSSVVISACTPLNDFVPVGKGRISESDTQQQQEQAQ